MKRKQKTCVWTESQNDSAYHEYETETQCGISCGGAFAFVDLEYKFCPYCGRRIKVKESTDGN